MNKTQINLLILSSILLTIFFVVNKHSSTKMRSARLEACFSGLTEETRKTLNCDEFLEIQKYR